MPLERLPRTRLAALPTPLEEAPRLSEALGGARILVKRDDLTGLAFGGNKTRKLEYLIADALGQGADQPAGRDREDGRQQPAQEQDGAEPPLRPLAQPPERGHHRARL